MLAAVTVAITAVLLLLAVWQRRIETRHRSTVVDEIRAARTRGADRPVGQYPQINVYACIGCGSCARACPENGVLDLVDGVAHVIQASKCIGHALCAQACPVDALTVGLGDVSRRPDIPQLSDELESSVPGLFVAGELSGLALIRHAVEQGVRAVDAIAERLARGPVRPGLADVVIAGAGPCGLAASLRAVELGLRYVTIDQDDVGGTVRKYPRRKLVMTQPVALPLGERLSRTEYRKEELVDYWEALIHRHGVAVETGVKLLGIGREDDHFVLRTTASELRSRCVLLALGRRGTPRRLGVPGEGQEKVLYQLVDAATYNGQDLLVVGGGDSAVEAATALADQQRNQVTLSYRKSDFFRLKGRNEERIRDYMERGRVSVVFESRVRRFEERSATLLLRGDGAEREIELPNDYAFVFAGGEAPFPLLKDVGVAFGAEALVA